MNTARSWLVGETRSLSLVLAVTAGLLVATAGAGLLTHQEWWSPVGLAGGALSLVLFGLFFTPWWMLGAAISLGLVVAAARNGLPS